MNGIEIGDFKSLEGARDTCSNLLTQWLDDLQLLWGEVGIPPEQQITRIKVVYENSSELCRAMVDEEKSRRDGYIENIAKCRSECQRLAEELETTFEEPPEEYTVLRKEKVLRNQVKQLIKERQLRLREAISLRTQEGELCARLGKIPEYIQSDTVLTKEQVKEANTRIGFLTAEKNKRDIKLAIAAKDILELWTELNIRARNDREEHIESGNLDSFQLSNENMQWLEQMKQSLSMTLDDNKRLQKSLMTKVQSLWTRMELPEEDQKKFLEQHTGYSDALIVKLKEEVRRLEELKLQNLERFIKLTRDEIEKYWELMFYSDEDKRLFTPYFSETVGENLLQEHEKKLECLVQEYNNYENLYMTIKSRNKMWERYEQMECKESDPNRFDNRGGKLLKEEKERKKILRDLPKCEDSIIREISTWESESGRIFTVFGHKFSDYLNNQKEELQNRKDQMKENKQKAKEEAMQNELTYGSTPAKTPKRRIAGTTILTPANKRTKTGHTPNTTPTRAARTPRTRFVHSSLVAKSPIRTPVREKNFPRVVVKVPGQKRPDTPTKKAAPIVEEFVPEVRAPAVQAPSTSKESSMDSGCVSNSNLDLDNQVADYADFENEVNHPTRELMRSSSVHMTASPENNPRKSLLFTIQESD